MRWMHFWTAINRKKVSFVLDADIRGFFDTIDHGCRLMKFIEHRVADKRILRLIQKWPKRRGDGEWTMDAIEEVNATGGYRVAPAGERPPSLRTRPLGPTMAEAKCAVTRPLRATPMISWLDSSTERMPSGFRRELTERLAQILAA